MYNVWTLPECLMKSCLISNNASERSHLNPQYKPAVRFLSLSPATPSVSPPFLSPSDKCLPFTSSLLPAVYISVCVSPRSTSAIIPVAVPLFFSTWPPSLSSSHYIAARLPPPSPASPTGPSVPPVVSRCASTEYQHRAPTAILLGHDNMSLHKLIILVAGVPRVILGSTTQFIH